MFGNSDRMKLIEQTNDAHDATFEKAQERMAQATRSLERSGVPVRAPEAEQLTEKTAEPESVSKTGIKDVVGAPGRDATSEWVDRGILDVPVADLPDPEGIEGSADFQKLSAPEMKAGLDRLEEMKPTIASGKGASSDHWAEHDRQHGLDYAHGYQRVYEAFYGNDAIRVDKDGDRYDIVNGRHRVWLAKRMDINDLPARVIERR